MFWRLCSCFCNTSLISDIHNTQPRQFPGSIWQTLAKSKNHNPCQEQKASKNFPENGLVLHASIRRLWNITIWYLSSWLSRSAKSIERCKFACGLAHYLSCLREFIAQPHTSWFYACRLNCLREPLLARPAHIPSSSPVFSLAGSSHALWPSGTRRLSRNILNIRGHGLSHPSCPWPQHKHITLVIRRFLHIKGIDSTILNSTRELEFIIAIIPQIHLRSTYM